MITSQIVNFQLTFNNCNSVRVTDSSAYLFPIPYSYFNMGVYYVRSTDGTGKVKERWEKRINSSISQIAYNIDVDSPGFIKVLFMIIPNGIINETYSSGDVVFYNDKFYYCINSSLFSDNDTFNWEYISDINSNMSFYKVEEKISQYLKKEKKMFSSYTCFTECIQKSINNFKCNFFGNFNSVNKACNDVKFLEALSAYMAYYHLRYIGVNVDQMSDKELMSISNAINKVCCCNC